ncbi:uncharacterized protein LOC124925596 [Impatiens glandulifera]|uniref:uncharacterized protein LOC124925596 n=1 Tax=Impatiens glandulifera TaxID=253017 RepID=UPI001FB0C110|nr:uncharacterized protein LOC124925596 [Impatiens glandulifera]
MEANEEQTEEQSSSSSSLSIHFVSSVDSPEFTLLTSAVSLASVVGLDAEWKPVRESQSTFPTVTLLQIACRLPGNRTDYLSGDSPVFLLDLVALPLSSVYALLNALFVSPNVLKLGFRFKQDLVYLSSTFRSQGCDPAGFDKVEPFLDITSIYSYLQQKQSGRKPSKQTKSLAAICEELLAISLSKELQCSDWSQRPLTKEQKIYASADAHCLLEIFDVFQNKVINEENSIYNNGHSSSSPDPGLKSILEEPSGESGILKTKFSEALEIIQATTASEYYHDISSAFRVVSPLGKNTVCLDNSLLQIIRKHGDKILLKESDREPKTSKNRGKKKSSVGMVHKEKLPEFFDDWQGPSPWDPSLGGDGRPKFLCDVMVEGLAKHLRCVGIDAAIPYSRKPETRELIDHALKEKRVLLTRDAKLLRHGYLLNNQIYRVKNLLKNDQLLEVIETFELKISEEKLMSRCTKCNGMFIQKPLSMEEAVEAAKGFQVIPSCLFDKKLEFWQCLDCHQLYWEGTQYHNAVQKFIDVCKLEK